MLVNVATIGIGVVAGFLTLPLVARILPQSILDERAKMEGFGKQIGLVNVAIGALLFGFMKNRRVKEAGLIIAGMGVYDLIAVNITQLGLPPLPVSSTAIDKLLGPVEVKPKVGASYPALVSPASRVAGAYGPSSYDGIGGRVGATYESAMTRSFGGDLDLDNL